MIFQTGEVYFPRRTNPTWKGPAAGCGASSFWPCWSGRFQSC